MSNITAKVDEIISVLRSGSVSVASEYRNEDAQVKRKVKRIDSLKKAPKKKSKVMVITELALPFNPLTGKEDEQFNRNNKYRPIMSTETAMLTYKKLANENTDTKSAFLNRTGLTEWDTSDLDNINDVDRTIFNKHRYPVIFTLNVVDINIPTFTGRPFSRQYRLDVNRDATTGAIEGEMPLALKINKLMADMANEAVKELEQDVKDGKLKYTKDDLADAKRKIYKDVVVSSDRPMNFVLALEIPLNAQSQISNETQLKDLTDAEIFSMLRLVKMSSKFQVALNNYIDGSYAPLDVFNNFWELDMICTKDEDAMELGKNTNFEKAMVQMVNHPDFKDFNQSFVNFMDEDQKLEQTFLASSYVTNFNPDLENNLLDAVANIIDLESPRMTKRVLQANQDIISIIFGEEGDSKLVEAEVGMVPEGNLDEKESAKEMKAMSLSSIIENDDLSLEDEELN